MRRADRPSQSRLLISPLGNGGTLIVGRDMRDQHELDHLMRSASVWAVLVTVLMAVGGALAFRRQLEPASARSGKPPCRSSAATLHSGFRFRHTRTNSRA